MKDRIVGERVIAGSHLDGLLNERGLVVRQSEIVIWSSAGEAGSLVEPAGAGLVTSSPPSPMQVMGFGQQSAGHQDEKSFNLGDGERGHHPGIVRKVIPVTIVLTGFSLNLTSI